MKSDYESIRDRAIEVLGSAERADEWLNTESGTLHGKPGDLIRSAKGRDKVLLHLHSVELNQPE